MANGAQQAVDYEALARKAGATQSQPAPQSGSVDYAALAKQAGAVDSQPKDFRRASSWARPNTADELMTGAKDVGVGAAKGVTHTGLGVVDLAKSMMWPNVSMGEAPQVETEKRASEWAKPSNTAQKIGFGGEQAAEWLLPTGAEEKGGLLAARMLPKLGKAAPILGRIGAGALESGVRNELQGGEFGAGALLGGGAGVVGEAGKAVAPSLAESALGVTKRLRGFGRTVGKAALEEIGGIRPGTVAENARAALDDLTSQLEKHAAKSTIPTTTADAVGVVDREMHKAMQRNSKVYYDQLNGIREQLTKDLFTGQPLGGALPASKLLDLKRGIGELERTWSPEQKGAVKGIVRRVYRALDNELDRAVPESAELNQRISSLIPVAQRAESTERGAEIGQRLMHRVAAHTGAMVPALAGGYYGYEKGGPLGAAAGFALPELLASPSGQMLGARALASSIPTRLGRGAASQLLGRKNLFPTRGSE